MAAALLYHRSVLLLNTAEVFLRISDLVVLSVQVRWHSDAIRYRFMRAANFHSHTWEWWCIQNCILPLCWLYFGNCVLRAFWINISLLSANRIPSQCTWHYSHFTATRVGMTRPPSDSTVRITLKASTVERTTCDIRTVRWTNCAGSTGLISVQNACICCRIVHVLCKWHGETSQYNTFKHLQYS